MEAFRHDDELVARDIVRLDGGRDELLRDSIGVVVGRVPGVDAAVECGLEQWEGRSGFDAPGEPAGVAEGHGPEYRVGNAQAGGAELDVFDF